MAKWTAFPYDAADYNSVTTASQTLVVNPAQPHTSWYVHSPISWGTTLSAAQLGASATDGHGNSVGTFTYQANGSAATLGEELDPGNYTLTATLTPTNPNYAGVTLTIAPANGQATELELPLKDLATFSLPVDRAHVPGLSPLDYQELTITLRYPPGKYDSGVQTRRVQLRRDRSLAP